MTINQRPTALKKFREQVLTTKTRERAINRMAKRKAHTNAELNNEQDANHPLQSSDYENPHCLLPIKQSSQMSTFCLLQNILLLFPLVKALEESVSLTGTERMCLG